MDCHFRDTRRPIGKRYFGQIAQVPVICELDVLEVRRGGDSWTEDAVLVTCPRCRTTLRVWGLFS